MVREALTSNWLKSMTAAEAAAYFVARQAEDLTPSEQALLENWLAAEEANRLEFRRAVRAWDSFDDAGNDEILSAMRAHALEPNVSRPIWHRAIAAAAMVVAFIGIGLLVMPSFTTPPGSNDPGAVGAPVIYASSRGQVQEFKLTDGSVMTLDADSVASGYFDKNRRTIDLQKGRAFFAVARDEKRPFAVRAQGYQVTAVGTRFDVSLVLNSVTVTLLQGKVTVGPASTRGAGTFLVAGQQLVLRDGKGVMRRLGSRADTTATWRSGLLNFDNQPLAEAAAIVNRYSSDQILIRDPAVAALRVSGQFKAGEATRFAQTAADLHNLNAVRTGNRIELRR